MTPTTPPSERIMVMRMFHDICTMSVCAVADVTDEEILEFCNRENPSGTSNGWARVERNNEERPDRNPVKCEEYDRTHFLVVC